MANPRRDESVPLRALQTWSESKLAGGIAQFRNNLSGNDQVTTCDTKSVCIDVVSHHTIS
jgi:hypothetical protein